ncbi:CRISPR-associated protein [Corynebacterium ulcerans]|uniref:type I-E CRISPR-associated protein Cas6/Cse3/CasE n=1 Tax=Corynebacterium ulcerans TaxID=65058 RepID=UPI00052114CF|nr:type I-E CRISPR-associated protein Cas6/Cse3/CasE [Corynebacterium ulcerans]AIU31156.1 CRISPR-associated protein [Corynebacterium ulcerans]NOL63132.1 type I-E CRISPR-associated protein Cas6/Cse3/CasE [Corynebacterium ulcerans]
MRLYHITIPVPEKLLPSSGNRLVMGLFGKKQGKSLRSQLKILFRLEEDADSFLIQSLAPPRLYASGIEVKEVDIAAPPAGTEVEFRFTVNPVRRLTNQTTGKITQRQCTDAPRSGDEFDSEAIDFAREKLSQFFAPESIEIDYRYRRQVQGTILTWLDTVEGLAVVSDPEALQHALIEGVGRSKSFGSGLLTIDVID